MPGADSWELQPLKVILRRGLRSNAFDSTPAAEGERDDLINDQEPIVLSSPMSLPSPIAPIAPGGTLKVTETMDAACQVEVSSPASEESNNSSTSPATTSEESTLTVPPPPPPPSPFPSLPPPSPPSESLLHTEADEDEEGREEDNDEDEDGSPAPDVNESSASESLNETAGTIPPLPPPAGDGAFENSGDYDVTEYSNDGFDSISSSGED